MFAIKTLDEQVFLAAPRRLIAGAQTGQYLSQITPVRNAG